MYPDADEDEAAKKAKRAVKVLSKIHAVPKHSEVINMTHHELNGVLQGCPESPYFARDDFETDVHGAR